MNESKKMKKGFIQISACFYLLHDIRGCYKDVDRVGADLFLGAGEVFTFFNSDDRMEKASNAFKSDLLYENASAYGLGSPDVSLIERNGMAFFKDICGALYMLVDRHKGDMADFNAETLKNAVDKAKYNLIELAKNAKAKFPDNAYGASKKAAIDKRLRKDLDSADMKLKAFRGKSMGDTKRLLSLLKPHRSTGESLKTFVQLLDKHL